MESADGVRRQVVATNHLVWFTRLWLSSSNHGIRTPRSATECLYYTINKLMASTPPKTSDLIATPPLASIEKRDPHSSSTLNKSQYHSLSNMPNR